MTWEKNQLGVWGGWKKPKKAASSGEKGPTEGKNTFGGENWRREKVLGDGTTTLATGRCCGRDIMWCEAVTLGL